MNTLTDIASSRISNDFGTKPLYYYKCYERFLKNNELTPENILEIGVYKGESTKIFSKAYPDAKVVAIDLHLRDIDFSDYPNVIYLQCDQTKPDQLISIIEQHFKNGIDLTVEDASHFGFYSKLTFDAVFPHVRGGGAYFIEDWGTGYWDSWPDGSRFQQFSPDVHNSNIPKRIPSHDFGMVGFVKLLVDMTHESAIRNNQNDGPIHQSRIKFLEFSEGVCMALKV